MKLLFESLTEGSCLLNLDARDMEQIVRESVEFLVQTGRLPDSQQEQVIEEILHRERTVPTVIGHAFAVPHYYDDSIKEPALVFVRLRHAINLGAPDGIATRYVFLMIGSREQTTAHLDLLSSIARLMSDNVFHFEATYAKNQQDVLDAMERHVNRNLLATPPKPRKISEGLKAEARPFAGIVGDLRRRLPKLADDFRAGLQSKSIASIIFLFFACLAPAITFGGIMGANTGNAIGITEMLVASAVCGILYALLAGQPLIILGGIGPLLIFTIILYRLCQDMELGDQFLSVYGWVGIWTALFTTLLGVFNASNLMKYFTRFTDEIFSVLMSLIFIYEAVKAIAAQFDKNAENFSYDTALLSLILALGTFYIAMTLAGLRRSNYLFPWMREFLADFGPSIALVCMTCVAWSFGDVELKTLAVDSGSDSGQARGWLVDLGAVSMGVRFAAAGPAALATVLVFLSQNITARLVNNPQNKLTKGESYHWDLTLVGLLIGLCSMFGFPWLVAATVRSLAHIRALADVEEVVRGDQRREQIIHVNENRVTGLAIHVMIAATLFVLPLLRYVPMAMLYGIFLFMGFVSLRGVQFMERLSLWITDSSMYPINHYTRRVPIKIIHWFTFLQLICLVVLCVVNVSPNEVRILFPVFIALLVPVRALLPRFFEPDHLAFLDADEEPDEEESHWL